MITLLEKTCCLLKLRTATLITGYLSFAIAFCSFLYFSSSAVPDAFYNKTRNGLIVFWVFYTFILAVTSVFLIIGATKGRKWLLVPWISVMFMMALQTMAGSGIFIYDLVKGAVKITTSEGLIWVISVFVSVALYLFLLIIVCSHFLELHNTGKEAKNEGYQENMLSKRSIYFTAGIPVLSEYPEKNNGGFISDVERN